MKYYSEKLDQFFDNEQDLREAENPQSQQQEFVNLCESILHNAQLAAKDMIDKAISSAEILLEDAKRDVQGLIDEYKNTLHDDKHVCSCKNKKRVESSFKDELLKYIHSL